MNESVTIGSNTLFADPEYVGTFYYVKPGTYDIKNPIVSFTLTKTTPTASEKDCFAWVSSMTLALADANPSVDVISTGSLE